MMISKEQALESSQAFVRQFLQNAGLSLAQTKEEYHEANRDMDPEVYTRFEQPYGALTIAHWPEGITDGKRGSLRYGFSYSVTCRRPVGTAPAALADSIRRDLGLTIGVYARETSQSTVDSLNITPVGDEGGLIFIKAYADFYTTTPEHEIPEAARQVGILHRNIVDYLSR